jgi:cysteine desulfurase
MIDGGVQQKYRSGTLNELGIKTTALALSSKKRSDAFEEIISFRKSCEKILKEHSEIFIIGDNERRSNNTIQFVHKEQKADAMLIHFDLNGLCVSSGSACNSGSLKDSEYLISLGLEDYSKNSIRISLGEDNLTHKEEIKNRLKNIILKL